MTIVISAILINPNNEEKDICFISDGRVRAGDDHRILDEMCVKTKKISNRICLAYAGQSGELYERVSQLLFERYPRLPNKQLLFITLELKRIILATLPTPPFCELEEKGPLIHKFIIGGLHKKEMRIYILGNNNNFEPDLRRDGYRISGSTDEDQKKFQFKRVETISDFIKNVREEFDRITTAEPDLPFNNNLTLRRLSNNFDIETM